MIKSKECQAKEHMKKAYEIAEDLDNPFVKGTEEYFQYEKFHCDLLNELNAINDKLMIFVHLQTKKAIEHGCCEADAQHDYDKEWI